MDTEKLKRDYINAGKKIKRQKEEMNKANNQIIALKNQLRIERTTNKSLTVQVDHLERELDEYKAYESLRKVGGKMPRVK